MKNIFLDFDAKEVIIPKMCCSNLKKYEEYILKEDTSLGEKHYIIQGNNAITDCSMQIYSNIQVLKEIIDIGEFLDNKFPRNKYNYSNLSDDEINLISTMIIKWCSKYGILYGEGINHSKSNINVDTFIRYAETLYRKFEIWAYISDVSTLESESLQYANEILQCRYTTLKELKNDIYPLDTRNDISNTELMFLPNLKNPMNVCNTIVKVIDLQFLFLCLSEEGLKNEYEQIIKINQCRSCQNYFATFNAKIKYCKYCNDPKVRATARKQKSRMKNKFNDAN